MFSLRGRVAIALLALAMLLPSAPFAGDNAGGRVHLSWDRAGTDSVLLATPVVPFALYLHLSDAPDVRAIAAKLVWTTNRADRPPCYALVSSPPPEPTVPPDSLFGWAVEEHPGADFRGDSSYAQSIRFPAGMALRNCVRFLVSSAGCGAPAFAMFEAVSVLVEDALGRVDTLHATAGARIVPAPLTPLAVDDVFPGSLPTRETGTLDIRGRGFEAGMRLSLRRAGQVIEANEVAVLDSNTLRARVTPWFGAGNALDVRVDHPLKAGVVVPSGLMEVARSSEPPGNSQRPSNEGMPFRQIDPMDSTRQEGTNNPVARNVGQPWPLPDNVLEVAVRASGDTAALILSHPQHGIGLSYDGAWPASVTYPIDPPVYATSLGTLLQGGHLYDGAGSFADAGKTLVRGYVHYEGGGSTLLQFHVDAHVRDWTAGGVRYPPAPYDSVNFWPTFVARPTDTLVCELLPGTSSMHYDFQEMRLPGANRNKRVTAVSFEASGALYRYSPWWAGSYHGTSALFGAALWPDFEVVSREGDPVTPQYQIGQPNSDTAYGGYRDPFTGELVGTHKTIGALGCYLADLAMLLSVVGTPISVPALNDTLQRTRGFEPEVICEVVAVGGQAVGDTVEVTPPAGNPPGVTPWSKLVIDRGGNDYAGALATLLLVDSTHAIVLTHPDPALPIAAGQQGKVYRQVLVKQALQRLTAASPIRLSATEYGQAANPAPAVEAALVDSLPALLFVGSRAVPHWVLATGWGVAFAGAAEARGTNDIVDPADTLGPSTLLDSFGNRFGGAWVPRRVPADSPNMLSAKAARGTDAPATELVLWLTGDASLSLVAPGGQSLAFDEALGEYVTNIPGAVAVRSAHPGDISAPPGSEVPADLIVLPAAGPAGYALTVLADRSGAVALTARHEVGEAYAGHGAAVATLEAGGRGYFRLSVDPGATPPVDVSLVSVAAVRPTGARLRLNLRVAPSPSASTTRLMFDLPDAGDIRADVFDVSGRRVRQLVKGRLEAGSHVVGWDGLDDSGRSMAAGLFFVRLQAAGEVRVARCVRVAP